MYEIDTYVLGSNMPLILGKYNIGDLGWSTMDLKVSHPKLSTVLDT